MKAFHFLLATLTAADVTIKSSSSPGLFPESIDYYIAKKQFIFGSLTRGVISTITSDGSQATLINDTLVSGKGYSIHGVQIDQTNNRLWHCASEFNLTKPTAASFILAYDLTATPPTRLFMTSLRDIDTPGDANGVLCNDIVQTKDGNTAYVTDSFGDRIFKVDAKTGKASLESNDSALKHTNKAVQFGLDGIEITGNSLIVTSFADNTFLKYDLGTKQVTKISYEGGVTGDGIYFADQDKSERKTLIVADSNGKIVQLESKDGWNTAAITAQQDIASDKLVVTAVTADDKGQVYVLTSFLQEILAVNVSRLNFPIVASTVKMTSNATSGAMLAYGLSLTSMVVLMLCL